MADDVLIALACIGCSNSWKPLSLCFQNRLCEPDYSLLEIKVALVRCKHIAVSVGQDLSSKSPRGTYIATYCDSEGAHTPDSPPLAPF